MADHLVWKKDSVDFIGPYRVLKVIGAGSFAEVKVGEHVETKEKVHVCLCVCV
jgi:hypothetical protein